MLTFHGVVREHFSGEVTCVGRPNSQKEADKVVLRSGPWTCVGRIRVGVSGSRGPCLSPQGPSPQTSVETAVASQGYTPSNWAALRQGVCP